VSESILDGTLATGMRYSRPGGGELDHRYRLSPDLAAKQTCPAAKASHIGETSAIGDENRAKGDRRSPDAAKAKHRPNRGDAGNPGRNGPQPQGRGQAIPPSVNYTGQSLRKRGQYPGSSRRLRFALEPQLKDPQGS